MTLGIELAAPGRCVGVARDVAASQNVGLETLGRLGGPTDVLCRRRNTRRQKPSCVAAESNRRVDRPIRPGGWLSLSCLPTAARTLRGSTLALHTHRCGLFVLNALCLERTPFAASHVAHAQSFLAMARAYVAHRPESAAGLVLRWRYASPGGVGRFLQRARRPPWPPVMMDAPPQRLSRFAEIKRVGLQPALPRWRRDDHVVATYSSATKGGPRGSKNVALRRGF